VTATDRELVAAIRGELAAIEPSRPCDRRAELAGLGGTPRRDPALTRLLVRLGRGISGPGGTSVADDAWATAPDHCRVAWLRGRYLAAGSLSVTNGRTHLEFVLRAGEARVLARRLSEMGLPAGLRLRRGHGVVTWKSAESVGRFLRLAGSSAALLELEARWVARSLRSDLNRVVNAEAANLSRSVEAAGRQLAAIAELETTGRLARQPAIVRRIADARRASPEASLTDLAERTGLHRSAVQRAFAHLVRAAGLEEEGAGGPGRRVVALS
jgi:DNA-binding transcriptional regulator WhiA